MKALLHFKHNGQTFTPGQVFDLVIDTDENHQALQDQMHLNRNNMPVYHVPTPSDLSPVRGHISETDLGALIEAGVVTMDETVDPKAGPMGSAAVMDQNRQGWRDDRARWTRIKSDQAVNRAQNLEPQSAYSPQTSDIPKGTKEDAAAAVAAAKAAQDAANPPADPNPPVAPVAPPVDPAPPMPPADSTPTAPEVPPTDPNLNPGVQS